MPAIFENLPHRVGDYTLLNLLGTQHDRDFYEAKQNHVDRVVIVEIIDAKKTKITHAHFVESARARVSEYIPNVMPVYEAVQLKDYWLVCQERPTGSSLAELAEREEQLDVLTVCRLIEQVCELYRYCNANRIKTTKLTANTIYQIGEHEFRFLSPARSHVGTEASRAEKMTQLADVIIPILPVNVAGQNRLYTLISWLQQGFEGQLLNWGAIGSTASLIIEQLHPDLAVEMAPTRNNELLLNQRNRLFYQGYSFMIFLMLIFGGTIAGIGEWVKPATVDTAHFEELVINMKPIAAQIHPVQVDEYHDFLLKLERMSTAELERLHKGIPVESFDHTPDNWGEQILQIHDKKTCTNPVHSVSYWDAIVYARFNRAYIPTASQLQFIKAVTDKNDFAEWSRDTQELPLYEKSYILINSDGSIERESDPYNTNELTSFRIIKSTKR